jgi:hypothetical protein
MPCYDFHCKTCDVIEERVIMLKNLGDDQLCSQCNTPMVRQFPLTAALGYLPFEPFYHEALDMDIRGRREQKEILSAHGLQEAGDRVAGARNEETSPLASRMDKLPPQGKTLSDQQRQTDRDTEASKDFEIGVRERGSDRPAEKRRMSDLDNLLPNKNRTTDDVISKSVDKGMAAA